ncbi:hypothetical protein XELAEV_18025632mg [Xenopus laevis]|uniref:SMB domain-containing protein n=1 Tax=Xenopus laevis TaxID=8355 RepID=A0A974D130_XENLA|nr:hypothetical protein XELAEV_18025632mg [Xenopus laevis]
MSYMECCQDFKAVCTTENSCRGRCHDGFVRGQACDCDPSCVNYGKCCPDYESICAKPIQRRSPAPRPPEERSNPPDSSKEKEPDKELDKVPQETDQRNGDLQRKVPKKPSKNKIGDKMNGSDQQPKESATATPPPNVKTPQPVKEKKRPPKRTKIPKKKPKKPVEAEEEVEETEENETSSMSSTTRTKGTTIKRSRTDQKKKKPKDKKINPKANATEPNKEGFAPSLPPPPDNNENALTPQTSHVGDETGDPNGSQEDSADSPPSPTTPKTTKKRSPSKTNKKKMNKQQENDEPKTPNNKKKPPKKPSPKDIKRKKKTDPKDEKQDPSKGSDTPAKKKIKKPVSKGPKKRIIKVLVEDSTDDPSKAVEKKKPSDKPSPKDNKKQKVDPKEERQETVESEFTSSSQSSSSHRRSKSTSRRLSEKNKDKNKKKIPDEKPLVPPRRKKGKDFLQTPEPTPRDEGSGDDGSGMEFLQTTPSTTSLPIEAFYSTIVDGTISSERPKPLSTDEHSLKTTPVMNISTDLSRATTDTTKEPFKQTENSAQPTEERTTSSSIEMGSKENSTSTEGTNGYSSPTAGWKTNDSPTSKQELTSFGNRTFVDSKETITTKSTTQPMESVSTATQVNIDSLQSTVKSSEKQQENNTKKVTTEPLLTEQQTEHPSVSSFPNSTVKYDLEQKPTVLESDNRNTMGTNNLMATSTKSTPTTIKNLRENTGSSATVKAISVEQMENKYNTNPPPPLDQYGICEMLLDKENKLGISESDLQHIREICMEIHSNFTSVSTPSSETKLPSQNPSDSPPKHMTTQSRVAQPNEKLLPGPGIIQIVEEISRRMHLPPATNITPFPSDNTRSAAWILLLKRIRSPHDPQMNLCNGQPVDGMTTLQNGSMVVFRGHYFWMLNQGGAVREARKISDVWGIPSPVDTAFTRCNCAGKTFFFKGPQYWRFTNDVMDKGYPKEIAKGFGGLKGKIAAVLSVAGFKRRPESVYFFKGGGKVQKYTFRQEQSKRCTKKKQPNVQYPIYSPNIQTVKYRYPRDILKQQKNIQRTIITIKQEPLGVLHQEVSIRSTWRGVPNNIVSAISLPSSKKSDGFDYFLFSKEKYYNINIASKVAVKPPPNSEQKVSKDWYKCKE